MNANTMFLVFLCSLILCCGEVSSLEVREFMPNHKGVVSFHEEMRLTILEKYDMMIPFRTLDSAIKKSGSVCFDPELNEKNFPVDDSCIGSRNLAIISFNRAPSSDEIVRLMKKEGYRPANLIELLVLCGKHKEIDKKSPIVVLGSKALIRGNVRIPMIWSGGRDGRCLSLCYWSGNWSPGFRFLAVRIKK